MRTSETFPAKNPGGVTVPRDPSHYFPLTRENMRTNLPKLLTQFLTYDAEHLQSYKAVIQQLYTPDARFHYPLAELNGREAVSSFWVMFLLARAVQLLDVYGLHVDCVWDDDKLQATVQMEAWQHHRPLAWTERLLGVPQWKVWTTQVFQFIESPSDGPGALRVCFQEELQDQFVFFGLIPCGLYCLRTDPGTPLNFVRSAVRKVNGLGVRVWATVMEEVARAVNIGSR